jgi:hypothetical protein
MNNNKNTIINSCLKHIEAAANVNIIHEERSSKRDEDIDVFIDLGHENEGGLTARYAVEIKKNLSRSLAETLLHKQNLFSQPANVKRILFTEHISMDIAKELKENGLEFVDCSGNMFINLPWLKVIIVGYPKNKPLERQTSLSSAVALKVIYTILTQPQATKWTHRETAKAAGVALGSVTAVYSELRSQGFLHTTENNKEIHREVVNRKILFDKWITGYEDKLRPKLYLGSYRIAGNRSIGDLPALLANTQQEQVLIGGELGATLLEKGNLRPSSATLHLDENNDAQKLSLQLKMIPDVHGNVVLLQTFGECNRTTEHNNLFSLTNPLLMYSELLQINDPRVREFAEHFFQSRINGVYNK